MPKMGQMFPSKWLAAADLNDSDVTLTVSDVTQEMVGQGDNGDMKWIVFFRERDKGLVLNKTNASSISSIYGDDTDEWIGQQVVLYPTEVDFQGKKTEAIRVKEKATRLLMQRAVKQAVQAPVKPRNAPVTQAEADRMDDQTDDIPF
jgi:hypothetical protein